MIQIQNEYGQAGSDKEYMEKLRKFWFGLDIKTDQFYIDSVFNIGRSHWAGAHIGIVDGTSEEQFQYAHTL